MARLQMVSTLFSEFLRIAEIIPIEKTEYLGIWRFRAMLFIKSISHIKIFLLALVIAVSVACTSQSQAPTGSKKKATEDDSDKDDDNIEDCSVDTSGSESDDSDTQEDSDDDNDDLEFDLNNSRSYSLKDFTYKGDFEEDFKSNCISCHAEGNEPNKGDEDYDCSNPGDADTPVAIDLSSVDLIEKYFDDILERMEAEDDCKMPPSGKLKIDVGDFEEWGDDGFELGESDDEDGDSNDTDTTPTKPGCGSTVTPPVKDKGDEYKPDSAFFKEFLNPAKLEECKSQGKLLKRSSLECMEKYDIAPKCDDAWVEGNTSWTAAALKAEVEKRESASNILLDQCGFTDTEAYILYFCPAFKLGGTCVTQKEVEDSDSDSIVIREFSVQLNLKKD